MKRLFFAFLLLFSFVIVRAQYFGTGYYKFDGKYDANGVRLRGYSPIMVYLIASKSFDGSGDYYCILHSEEAGGLTPFKKVYYVETKDNWHIYTSRNRISGVRSFVLISLDGKKIRYIYDLKEESNYDYNEYVYYGKKSYKTDELPLH